ncbi:MAG TPA: malate synthase A, partial [Thermoanaerobaculia bacterium]|nr:malate synthase A [Thermoanaerobaculia bacterium]
MPNEIRIAGPETASRDRVLTREALAFVAELQGSLGAARDDLLYRRAQRQQDFARGIGLDFLDHTKSIRLTDWTVAPAPLDLQDRRVEITGPVERKMMINAHNSGANVFMADFEDSLSPTWANVVEGQANLMDAVRRQIAYRSPEGKEYRLNERTATLRVRPRG